MEPIIAINGIEKTEAEWIATYRSMKRWEFEDLTGIRNLRELQDQFTQPAESGGTGSSNPVSRNLALWRLKAVMQLQGIITGVEAAINALPEPDKTIALAGWNNAASVSRDSPLVAVIAAAVPMTEPELDALFLSAYELPA